MFSYVFISYRYLDITPYYMLELLELTIQSFGLDWSVFLAPAGYLPGGYDTSFSFFDVAFNVCVCFFGVCVVRFARWLRTSTYHSWHEETHTFSFLYVT